jgi:hypothetical protein
MLPISRIKQGHAIKIAGHIAYVVSCVNELTIIIYEDGSISKYNWEAINPFVEDLGKAQLKILAS